MHTSPAKDARGARPLPTPIAAAYALFAGELVRALKVNNTEKYFKERRLIDVDKDSLVLIAPNGTCVRAGAARYRIDKPYGHHYLLSLTDSYSAAQCRRRNGREPISARATRNRYLKGNTREKCLKVESIRSNSSR
ncbi:hypothetical protein EVAR_36142_1 [Eumeta japonica]|uniref:Uncharacterized protein n=1 Tax=Eumeta variegata TaxID=151549 RepID=A0A4C1X2Z1_EUMVA|nr:hypothetical protein EVAR_36142_1 [Eumeta japonica]